jgi:hypothetical protein
MPAQTRRPSRRPQAAPAPDRTITLPLIHTSVPVPRSDLPYFAVVGALAALELIEWPVALVVAAGHALATRSRNPAARAAGEGAEAA